MADNEYDDFDEDLDVEDETPKAKKGKGSKAAKPKKDPGVGATQIATHIGVDPKQFRAWLRGAVKRGEVELPEREGKARYHFGNTINSPLAKKVIKAYKDYQAGVSERRKEQGKKLAAARAKGKKAPAKGKARAKK